MNIDELCRDLLAASEEVDLPWHRDGSAGYLICQKDLNFSFAEIKGNVDAGSEEDRQADYLILSANAAPALARECIRLREALVEARRILPLIHGMVIIDRDPGVQECIDMIDAALEQEPRQ